MTAIERMQATKPNLMRVVREIASYEDPDGVLHALGEMLAAHKGTSNPFPRTGTAPATTTNIQRLTDRLNNCQHPRAVFNALAALADYREESRT